MTGSIRPAALRLLHRGPGCRRGRRPGRLHPRQHGQLAAGLPGRAGLSVHEISARLRAEGTPLNRTRVGQILPEEGLGWLLRGPAPETSASLATAGRDTRLPGPPSSTWRRSRPRRYPAGGQLMAVATVPWTCPADSGRSATRHSVIAQCRRCGAAGLKLPQPAGRRRTSLPGRRGPALFAGLAVRPKKSRSSIAPARGPDQRGIWPTLKPTHHHRPGERPGGGHLGPRRWCAAPMQLMGPCGLRQDDRPSEQ